MHLGDGIYYGLNAVGARLWSLLEEPRAVAELRDALVADYEVDAETAERDVIELMDELMERGLVEPATDG
nr:PqqD family protein [Longimicrobium terrae]